MLWLNLTRKMPVWATPVALLLPGLAAAQPGVTEQRIFDSSSAFVVPAGVTRVDVQAWGGGGGGAGADSHANRNRAGGGGAGGSYTSASDVAVVPGEIIYVTVGAGGVGGKGGNIKTEGGTGGTSVFAARIPVVAIGGAGGMPGLGRNETGAGAVRTRGISADGGSGAEAPPGGGDGVDAIGSGAGGGAGGPAGPGGNASGIMPGKGGAGGGGAGAPGLSALPPKTWSDGNPAVAVGGGGSGGWDNLADNNQGDGARGGDGFRGRIIVTYTVAPTTAR
ncbi:MAG: hypothetical protein IT480_13905 [Gammaproteobacteria bacterium]|nr:hypothetical protein [Gammaproteobacteria bacterium]